MPTGETGGSRYRGRLLQGHFVQNCRIDGEIADGSSIIIHQRNYSCTGETKPSMHANYSRYGHKSLFIPLKLVYASSQLFFQYRQSRRIICKKWNILTVYNVSQHYINDASLYASLQHACAFIRET